MGHGRFQGAFALEIASVKVADQCEMTQGKPRC